MQGQEIPLELEPQGEKNLEKSTDYFSPVRLCEIQKSKIRGDVFSLEKTRIVWVLVF